MSLKILMEKNKKETGLKTFHVIVFLMIIFVLSSFHVPLQCQKSIDIFIHGIVFLSLLFLSQIYSYFVYAVAGYFCILKVVLKV